MSATEHKINDPREMFNVNKDAMLKPSEEKAAVSITGPHQNFQQDAGMSFNVSGGLTGAWNAQHQHAITPETNLLPQIQATSMQLNDQHMRGVQVPQSSIGELGAGMGGLLKDLSQELSPLQPSPHLALNNMGPKPMGLFG